MGCVVQLIIRLQRRTYAKGFKIGQNIIFKDKLIFVEISNIRLIIEGFICWVLLVSPDRNDFN